MKKTVIILILLILCSTALFAGGEKPKQRYDIDGRDYYGPEIYDNKIFKYKQEKFDRKKERFHIMKTEQKDNETELEISVYDNNKIKEFSREYTETDEGWILSEAERFIWKTKDQLDKVDQQIDPEKPLVLPWNVSMNFQASYSLTFTKYIDEEKGTVTFTNIHDIRLTGRQQKEIFKQFFDVLVFEDNEILKATTQKGEPYINKEFKTYYYYGKGRGLIYKEVFFNNKLHSFTVFKKYISQDEFQTSEQPKECLIRPAPPTMEVVPSE
ncbi:hypothetical protein ACFL56_00375 [Candidatus Margulisiibacteriota bacterium]